MLHGWGLTQKEIGERLGMTKAAVNSRLSDLRRKPATKDAVRIADKRRAKCSNLNRGGHPKGVPNPNAGNFEGRRKSVAKGQRAGCNVQAKIGFDDETFAEIRARALAAGIGFSREVRELVELGLETLKLAEAEAARDTARG